MQKKNSAPLLQILFLFLSFHAYGANYYVNDNSTSGDRWCSAVGNDANNGTAVSTPKLTLLSVLTSYDLGAGDIVYIDHGTYSWTGINWAVSASNDYGTGTGANVLTIQGAGTGGTYTTAITSSSGTLFNFPSSSDTYDYITFDGLSMTAASTADVFYLGQPDYITVQNCTLVGVDAGSVAFHTFNAANNCTLTSCYVRATGTASRAIHVEQASVCSDLTIERNHIDGVTGSEANWGIYDDQGSINFTCRNNFFSNFLTGVYRGQDRSGAVIYNNSFYCKNYCIQLDEAVISTLVKNNILYCYGNGAGDYPLYLNSTSNFASAAINYNLYYSASSNIVRWSNTDYATLVAWKASTNTPEANGKNGDPGYTSATTCNLAIGSGSPAADSGLNGLVSNDITEFGTRGNPPEIGAFEVGSLPIELLSFDVVCKNNTLEFTWSTASEINNDYFTIERSEDGQNWNILLTAKGAGNSNQVLFYTATDPEPAQGIYYYRLKQNDFDGRFEYSGLIASNCGEITDINVFPNPGKGYFHLNYSEKKDQVMAIEVYDAMGQKIYFNKEMISEIDLSSQAEGIYFIKIILRNSIIFRKIETIK
ncbi:MAG: T9SS type A sorting domain-containing protein [Flavobacteriales bacterium]